MKLFSCLLVAAMVVTLNCSAFAEELYGIRVNSMAEMQEYFRYDVDKPVIISGHRGGMLPGYPENSIEAMEKTLTALPTFFEIDPQLTKDDVLVLMHDKTLNRTTTMTGDLKNYTYAELKETQLKDREGKVTDFNIPTLKEALDWGKDKTIFNLDNKGVPWERYVELLKDNDYPNIVLSVRSLKEATYYYDRLDNVMFCLLIKNQADLDAFIKTGIPFNRIIAFVGFSMDPEQTALHKFLRSKGVMCFISIHPTQDKKEPVAPRLQGYVEELMKKPDIIETDYPSLFAK